MTPVLLHGCANIELVICHSKGVLIEYENIVVAARRHEIYARGLAGYIVARGIDGISARRGGDCRNSPFGVNRVGNGRDQRRVTRIEEGESVQTAVRPVCGTYMIITAS